MVCNFEFWRPGCNIKALKERVKATRILAVRPGRVVRASLEDSPQFAKGAFFTMKKKTGGMPPGLAC